MNKLEEQLLGRVVGDVETRLCLCTETRIDAGRWWRRTPVWLCVTEDTLVVLAVARRKYVERVPLSECRHSFYHHATGELVIEPGEIMRFRRFALEPGDALKILKVLNPEN